MRQQTAAACSVLDIRTVLFPMCWCCFSKKHSNFNTLDAFSNINNRSMTVFKHTCTSAYLYLLKVSGTTSFWKQTRRRQTTGSGCRPTETVSGRVATGPLSSITSTVTSVRTRCSNFRWGRSSTTRSMERQDYTTITYRSLTIFLSCLMNKYKDLQ